MSPKQRKSLKKLSKFFQVAISTVQNVINKYRLRASVEAKKGPGKTFKTACMSVGQANLHKTMKDPREGLASTEVMVHHVRLARRKPYLWPHQKTQCMKSAKQHLDQPVLFKSSKATMRCWKNKVKWVLDHIHGTGRFIEKKKKKQHFKMRTFQLLSIVV